MTTRKILYTSFIAISLFSLYVFQEPLASMMHWFSNPQAVSEAVQHSGIWGPTILFVLKEIMQTIKTGNSVFGAAFGPGLTMETFTAAAHA